MDQFSQPEISTSVYRRKRSLRLFGIRIGPRRQVIYAALTIIVSLFLNFVFLYPVNHFWALVLFSIAISSVLFSDTPRRVAVAGSAATFITAGTLYALVGPAVPAEPVNRNWLVPMQAPTPPNICTPHIKGKLPPDMKLVLIGNSAVLLHEARTTPLLSVGACHAATLYETGAGILLNVEDTDDDGQLMFRIINNQLQLNDGRPVYQERTPAHGSAAINSENGDELLRLTYLNPQTLRLRGIFACKAHAPVHIEDDKPVPGVTASCLDGRGVAVP